MVSEIRYWDEDKVMKFIENDNGKIYFMPYIQRKDNNGKKIFLDDAVRFSLFNNKLTEDSPNGIIVLEDSCFQIYDGEVYYRMEEVFNVEVVGNRFEG